MTTMPNDLSAFWMPFTDNRGFKAEPRGEHDYRMGAVQAIRLHQDGRLEGAADPRRDGSAEGL